MIYPPKNSTLFPYTTLFRSWAGFFGVTGLLLLALGLHTTVTWPFGGKGFEYANIAFGQPAAGFGALLVFAAVDRKSTRLNSSHMSISYAVFCLKKKNSFHNT